MIELTFLVLLKILLPLKFKREIVEHQTVHYFFFQRLTWPICLHPESRS